MVSVITEVRHGTQLSVRSHHKIDQVQDVKSANDEEKYPESLKTVIFCCKTSEHERNRVSRLKYSHHVVTSVLLEVVRWITRLLKLLP